jgi:hypothetical protein
MSGTPDDFGRRFCVSVDAQSYGDRDDQRQTAVQDGLIRVLTEAADRAGLHRERWDKQPGGDGELAVLPAVDPESEPRVVDDYVRELDVALARYNRWLQPEARLRLRVAMHFGVTFPGSNGYSGQAAVAVSRLIEAQPLRDALSAAPDANLALILSSRVYEEIVQQGHTSLRAADFRKISVQVKKFAEMAWIRVPGVDVHRLDLPTADESPQRRHDDRAHKGRNATVVNEFNDTVHAENALFGISNP